MRIRFAATLLAAMSVAGCMTYRFEGVQYSSEQQAFNAQQQRIRTVYAGVEPVQQKVGGRLLACIPDSETIYENGTIGGAIGRKYVAKILEEDYKSTIEVINRRAAFDQVEVVRTKGDRCAVREGDQAAIYLYMPSLKLQQWYFTNKIIEKQALSFDKGESDLSRRYYNFSSTVENLARNNN